MTALPSTYRLHTLSSRAGLWLVVGCFLALAITWAVRVPLPVGESAASWGNFNPDEANHLAVIRYMALHAALPPYELIYHVSHHPPLYHVLGALVYSVAMPLLGPDWAAFLLRLLSCLMGAGTIVLVHRTASLYLPPSSALLAASFAAGIPMFVSLSGAISNENLSTLTAAGSLCAILEGLRLGFDARRTAILSGWVATAVGTKFLGLGLLPIAAAAIFWAGRRRRTPVTVSLARAVSILCASAALTGWWYARNQILYGDPLRERAIYALCSRMTPGFAEMSANHGMSAVVYLWQVTRVSWLSFWGVFDGMERPMPAVVYLLLAGTQIASFCGLAILWRRAPRHGDTVQAVALLGLFAVFSIAAYYRFNWVLFSPQGRYLHPLLTPFALLTATGWGAFFPRRGRTGAMAVPPLLLLLINLYAALVMPLRT